MGYKVGDKILIKTSYRDKNKQLVLAGRPGVIISLGTGYWPEYEIRVQMPDGPYDIKMRQSTDKTHGILLDNPKNRDRYPIPDWEQIDLAELHWPKLMKPAGIKVDSRSFDGFIGKMAEACGGIDVTEIDMDYSLSYRWHGDYTRENELRIYIFPSEARVKAFWELLKWTDWYGKTRYATGVKKGHNLLLQINQGKLTMEMFAKSAAEEMSLSRVYATNPWGDQG
jgi:hypothetical protein